MGADDLVLTSSPGERNASASLAAIAGSGPGDPPASDPVDPVMSSWRDPSLAVSMDSRTEARPGADFVRWWIACFPGRRSLSPTRQADLRSLGMFASRGAEYFPVLLFDALRDLDQVGDEAGEEGFPPPSEVAARNAAGLLMQMFACSDRRYEIYPTPDGEIAIDAPDGQGQSVLVLCASSGDVLCLVNMKTGHRRARYSTAAMLPDGFIREALADLDRTDH